MRSYHRMAIGPPTEDHRCAPRSGVRCWLAGALAAAFIAAPALADLKPAEEANPRPPEAFYERVDELVEWIGENSRYGEMESYPAFAFLTREVLNFLYYEGSPGMAYDGQEEVKALYIEGMMFLSEDLELGEDDYVLLHELVHHLQWEAGHLGDYPNDRFGCLAEVEREAYELQAKFVEETGRGEVPSPLFMVTLRCDPW
jgi:hypothetical protein